jgi:hypothetical protein
MVKNSSFFQITFLDFHGTSLKIPDNNQLTAAVVQGSEAWPWRVTWHNKAYASVTMDLMSWSYKSEDGLLKTKDTVMGGTQNLQQELTIKGEFMC